MKKATAILLALLMLAVTFVSCADSSDPEESTEITTAAVVDPTPETDSNYDDNGYLKDNIPADTNFGGETVSILYWSDVERPEFTVDELSGDLVKDAIYTRNLHVEDRLGVTLNWIGAKGNYSNLSGFISTIENDYNGSGEYQIYAGYSMFASTATVKGFHRDLKTVGGLDFSQPWWPATFLDTVTIRDKVYFCTGDISTNTLYMMYCTWYTKELADEYKITDLYDLANNGKWTIDKMMEYASVAFSDTNGDQAMKYGDDQFGFMTANLHFDAFFYGSGLMTIAKDAEGSLIIDESYGSEKSQNLISKLATYFSQEYCDTTATSDTNVDVIALSQGRCLFNVNRCYVVTWNSMADPMGTYGILPVPKYDENQDEYITCMANPHTQYGLSVTMDGKTADMVGTVLECMASEAYRNTSPALFELTMKLKYATAHDDSEMYDIIRRTVTVDIGRIFHKDLNNLEDSWRNAVSSKSTSWNTIFKGNSKSLNKLLKDINAAVDAVAGQ